MTTTLITILVVMACLWAMTCWALFVVARVRNRSSTRRSPTPNTTPTPTSDDLATKMIETMAKTQTDSIREMRQMVVDLTQGRESPSPNGERATAPMPIERPLTFDYDSTPLSAGIEAVLAREAEETEQARLLREREELQALLIEKQTELDRASLAESSRPDEPHLPT